jgi:peptide/nickel transport system permease protein
MVALSIPTFWFGLVMIYLFSVTLGWLPSGNMYTEGQHGFLDGARHLVLPCLVLTLVTVATWSRYMRASMLDVINTDYVRTARAKGLSERRVILGHVFRNALIPLTTVAALNFGVVLGGAIVTETVFTLDGIGFYFVQKLGQLDVYAVMAYLIVTAVIIIFFNLVADVLYGFLDPRIRYD